MATISSRVAALEAWKSAHINGHVLSGHSHAPSSADTLTADEVTRLRALLTVPAPTPTPTPEPVPSLPPAPGTTRTIGPADNLQGALNDGTLDTLRLRAGSWAPGYVVLPKRPSSKPLRVVADDPANPPVFTAGSAGTPRLVARGGASYVSWDGTAFDNANPGDSGLLIFGGYDDGGCHHIAMRNIRGTRITGTAPNSHLVYLSGDAVSRPAEIDLDDFDFDCPNQSVAALHSFHNPNAVNVRARRWKVRGAYEAALMWSDLTGLLIEDWTVSGCKQSFDINGPTGVVRRVTATGAGQPSRFGPGIQLEQVLA